MDISNPEKNLQSEIRPGQNRSYILKLNVIYIFVSVLLAILLIRIFYIQVIYGDKYQVMALNNKEQRIRIPAYRGEIYTRKGDEFIKIVRNQTAFSLFLIPNSFPKEKEEAEALILKISENFDISTNKLHSVVRKGRWNPFRSFLLKNNLPVNKVIHLAENNDDYPGLFYQDTPQRVYKDGMTYSHITGYVREISPSELQRRHSTGRYFRNSIVGKMGIERQYDDRLRGTDGYKIQIVDARNRVTREITPLNGEPIPGGDIYLTIDDRIQKIVYDMMQGFPGGCVVTRPATGEVLALYSYPSYDPNIFIGDLDITKYTKYTNNKKLPFFNRVVQGEYPPSSVFKIIVSCAGLADDEISFWGTRYTCHGGIDIGPQYFKCEGYHNQQHMSAALANSCNVYYYRMGIDIGPLKIIKYAHDYFKLGQRTGIDLPFERRGRVPTLRWKSEMRGTYWWDGDTANMSIGQGFLLATVIQLNTAVCAIANGGFAYQPHLLHKWTSAATGKDIEVYAPQSLVELPLDITKIRYIRRAMRNVVEWGTARKGAKSRLKIAGKTGTAQNIQGRAHAWFNCYAPYNSSNPEELVAVTVFLEHWGSGGSTAAPFATAILESIFYGSDVKYNYKRIMQHYKGKEHIYQEWLGKRNQSKLPESMTGE